MCARCPLNAPFIGPCVSLCAACARLVMQVPRYTRVSAARQPNTTRYESVGWRNACRCRCGTALLPPPSELRDPAAIVLARGRPICKFSTSSPMPCCSPYGACRAAPCSPAPHQPQRAVSAPHAAIWPHRQPIAGASAPPVVGAAAAAAAAACTQSRRGEAAARARQRRPRRRVAAAAGGSDEGGPGEEDVQPPQVLGDWRAFRAKLVAESGAGGWAARQAEDNRQLLQIQVIHGTVGWGLLESVSSRCTAWEQRGRQDNSTENAWWPLGMVQQGGPACWIKCQLWRPVGHATCQPSTRPSTHL